jgi:hypothetical protein
MIIQLNTDENILGSEKLKNYLISLIREGLSRFSEHITRIEIHLSDKMDVKGVRMTNAVCLKPNGKQPPPIAVTIDRNTLEHVVSDALDKLNSSINKQLKAH